MKAHKVVAIRESKPETSCVCGTKAKIGCSAEMCRMRDTYRAHTRGSGHGDRVIHGDGPRMMSERVIGVEDGGRRAIIMEGHVGSWIDPIDRDSTAIVRKQIDAVGINAPQRCLDQGSNEIFGLFRVNPEVVEVFRHDARERLAVKVFHRWESIGNRCEGLC